METVKERKQTFSDSFWISPLNTKIEIATAAGSTVHQPSSSHASSFRRHSKMAATSKLLLKEMGGVNANIQQSNNKKSKPPFQAILFGLIILILILQGKVLHGIFFETATQGAQRDSIEIDQNIRRSGRAHDVEMAKPFHREQEVEKDTFPFEFQLKKEQRRRTRKYAVDILSIASLSQLNLAIAQHRSWATHRSVRFFWNATEVDDPDPNCYKNADVKKVVNRTVTECKTIVDDPSSKSLREQFRMSFASREWLQKKANPVGWICAQKRPAASLAKLGRTYRAMLHHFSLPDYLLVVDDDTYINLEIFEKSILQKEFKRSDPVVYAGCLIRWPPHTFNWTFPYGGFGTFWNRAALKRLIQPIYCSNSRKQAKQSNKLGTDEEDFEDNVCQRIHENLLGERSLFVEGMSVSDLMGAMSAQNPYCMHSDWSQGYFVNYYFLSGKEEAVNLPNARFHPLDGSEIVRRGPIKLKPPQANCKFNGGTKCNLLSHACHRMSEREMYDLTSKVKKKYPKKFITTVD